jgi:hypothetical protein
MSTETGKSNLILSGDPVSPWVDGVGVVIQMANIQIADTIGLAISNSTPNGDDSQVMVGAYRPNNGAEFDAALDGKTVKFEMWASADKTQLNIPFHSLSVSPQQIYIQTGQKITIAKGANYYFMFYVWFQQGVTDIRLTHSGGGTNTNVWGYWCDVNGTYPDDVVDLSDPGAYMDYPISHGWDESSSSSSSSLSSSSSSSSDPGSCY